MTQKRPPKPPEDTTPERASGTIDRPIGTGDAQQGDLAERGADFGGPVDVFPTRRDRSGLEPSRSTDAPDAAPEEPSKR
jgi:hypothetical protein